MADGTEAIWEQLSRLFVLSTFNRKLNSSVDTAEVLRLGSRLVGELLELSGFALYLVRSGGDGLELVYVDEEISACYEDTTQLAIHQGIAGRAIAARAPRLVNGLLSGNERSYADAPRPQGAQLCVPLFGSDGEVLGTANFHRSVGQAFSTQEQELIEEVGSDLGRALCRARVFDRVRLGTIYDELTGLYNRTYLKEQIEHEAQQQRRYRTVFSVAFLDVDHFKAINDTYGHGVGDSILRGVAERARATLRGADTLCRYGGEEFVLLLPHTNREEARAAVGKVREAIASEAFAVGEGSSPVRVTATAGVASAPTDAEDAQRLLEIADQRLYAGKLDGRNQVIGRDEPEAAGQKGRRGAERYAVALSATHAPRRVLSLEVGPPGSGTAWQSCIVEDISKLGMRAKAPIAPEPGELLPVRVVMEDEARGGEEEITVTARVVHMRRLPEGGACIGGLFEGEARSQWREVYEAFHAA